jgi:hypothetical protein
MCTVFQRLVLATLAFLGSATISAADEVRLISVGGVKTALDPIITDFIKATDHTVKHTVDSPLVVVAKAFLR